MRAGPSDYRRRPRSPVRPEGDVGARLNEASDQYLRLIAEGRAGRRFQSRRKSLILTIIEYYLHLLELAITASGGARNYLRSKWQVEDIYSTVQFAHRLPLRSEPIIPGTNSDLESENAESVYPPQSEDEELEQGTEDPTDPRAVPPWRRPPEPDHPPPRNLESSASASSTAPEPIASSSAVTSSGSHSVILPKATGGRPVFCRRVTFSGESSAGATASGESHAALSGESHTSAKAVDLIPAPSAPPKVPPKVSQDLPSRKFWNRDQRSVQFQIQSHLSRTKSCKSHSIRCHCSCKTFIRELSRNFKGNTNNNDWFRCEGECVSSGGHQHWISAIHCSTLVHWQELFRLYT